MSLSDPVDGDSVEGSGQIPFFLVGPLRSGTTLLRLILGHHSKICRCEEMEYVTSAIAEFGGVPDTLAYERYLSMHRGFRASGYTFDSESSFEQVARRFLRQRQQMDRRPFVGAAVHHHFDKLPLIWPNAKYIFLNRDPRDVARSCRSMGFSGTVWGGANIWLEANRAWERLCQIVPPVDRVAVQFESLVIEPDMVVSTICRLIDIPYEPTMLSIESDTTYHPPDSARAASWRDSAPVTEIRAVELCTQPFLESAGYTLSGLPPLSDNALLRMWFAFQDRIGRARARQRKYGLPLWFCAMMTRHFALSNLHRRTLLRMHEIDRMHLK